MRQARRPLEPLGELRPLLGSTHATARGLWAHTRQQHSPRVRPLPRRVAPSRDPTRSSLRTVSEDSKRLGCALRSRKTPPAWRVGLMLDLFADDAVSCTVFPYSNAKRWCFIPSETWTPTPFSATGTVGPFVGISGTACPCCPATFVRSSHSTIWTSRPARSDCSPSAIQAIQTASLAAQDCGRSRVQPRTPRFAPDSPPRSRSRSTTASGVKELPDRLSRSYFTTPAFITPPFKP